MLRQKNHLGWIFFADYYGTRRSGYETGPQSPRTGSSLISISIITLSLMSVVLRRVSMTGTGTPARE